jgi:SAM-dependent MidA family methyltransferase
MRQCLTNPDGGYYTSRGSSTSSDPFGKRGDFITSPEISQIFGELVGLWTYAEWKAQDLANTDTKVQLMELGPGRGTLMDDVLRTLRNFGQMMGKVERIWLVEASERLRERQHTLLCEEGDVLVECEEGWKGRCKYAKETEIVWVEDMKFVPSGTCACLYACGGVLANEMTPDPEVAPFIIAHEFFDALPIHVFQSVAPKPTQSPPSITTSTATQPPSSSSSTSTSPNKPNEWREMLVNPTSPYDSILNARAAKPGVTPPDFELIVSPKPTPHSQLLPRLSERYTKLLPTTGATIEISPESLSLMGDIAKRIGGEKGQKAQGAALILDYGPSETIPTNSLRGIQNHKPTSPFTSAGAADLSADVDFLGLAHAALDASPRVEVHGPVEQAVFLGAMGVRERAEMLMKTVEGKGGEGEKEVRERILGSWRRLVDRGPDGMGKTYKALAVLPFDAGKEVRRPVGFGGDVKV